jgi:alpha,alpha-trehalase
MERLKEMAGRLGRRKPAVFLDYDGTLTPIVSHPDQAELSAEARDAVARLARVAPVAVISGRDRRDVAARVGLESLVYAGSHGFDIAGPGGALQYEVGGGYSAVIEQAARELRRRLATIDGAIVEAKKYSVAVHYRLVAPDEAPEVTAIVDEVGRRFAEELTRTTGKKVFELRPRVDWDKGRALIWLLQALHHEGPDVVPIYAGDDVTDEDAFGAIEERGIGVLVAREPRPTRATFRLRDSDEVRRFLVWLTTREEKKGSVGGV